VFLKAEPYPAGNPSAEDPAWPYPLSDTRIAEGEMSLEPLPNKQLIKDLVTEIAPPDERLK